MGYDYDMDWDDRDELSGHHAAGAAEAAAEDALDWDPDHEMEIESRPWYCPFD